MMLNQTARRFVPAAAGLALLFLGADVLAHVERFEPSPIRPGPVPDLNRKNPNTLVVCKATSKPTRAEHRDIHDRLRTETGAALAQAEAEDAAWHRNARLFRKCRYEHIQEAVNAAGNNTDILVMPGLYREEPSREVPETSCGDLENCAYSYNYHVANPHDANLIAIMGKTNITLEGTGWRPQEVLVDTGFAKDVGIRCDQCTGFIVRNLWQRDAVEHGIYVLYSDGYIFDRAVASYNLDYSLFSYASDNGLYTDCEGYGSGDAAIYVGASPDTSGLGRFSTEIRGGKFHHSALGFSGTQGTSIWMHDNDFYDNSIGISYNSQNDHQDPPQRQSLIENNLIHDNNFDVYASTSDVPPIGPAYSFFRYPVGTAMWIVGGDDNTMQNNLVYNNSRFGFIAARNPLEAPVPANINRNRYIGNLIGKDPLGNLAPNSTAFPPGGDYAPGGSDFWWDESGNDNCWGLHDPASGPIKTDPPNSGNPLPVPGPCPSTNVGGGSAIKLELLLNCLIDENNPPHSMDVTYPCPWVVETNPPYQNGDEAECGNGLLDLGEDCDPGYGGGGGFIPADTCESLGQGSGPLACSSLCTWNTTGCTAPGCREYGASKLRVRGLPAPAGDDHLAIRAFNLPSAGVSFNPLAEEVSVVLRDPDGLVHSAVIPAGDPHWSASPSSYSFNDSAGTFGGITSLDLKAIPGAGNRALVRIDDVTLAAAANARTATAVLRVGDDCWSDTLPCTSRGQQVLSCRGPAQP